jgi:4-amino-4-deoxy-L-arabinose transferase-like glycosyltransferase
MILMMTYQVFQLNKYDLQPWDEALYAVRAKYIVETGNWLDQTQGAVDGLYSSVHPPLYIWLTSLTVKFFGNQLFFYRVWSLIFGLLTLLILFLFFKDKKKGLIAVLIAGTSPFYLSYFHLGQLDTIYTFFLILGLLYQKRYFETDSFKYQVLTALVFGLALMSKMLVGLLLPISIAFVYFVIILRDKTKFLQLFKGFSLILIIGLSIALPWHLSMYKNYGQDFINSMFGYHLMERMREGIESNTTSLGPLFFINQLIIQFSLPVIFAAIIFLKKRKKPVNTDILLLSFFVVPFLIFSVSATQLRTYAFPMILPLSLYVGRHIFEVKKIKVFALILIPIISLWSVSQPFRDALQKATFPHFYEILLVIMGVIFLVIFRKNLKIIFFVSLIFLLSRPFYFNGKEYREHNFEIASKYFQSKGFEQLVYIDDIERKDDPLIVFYFDFMRNKEKGNYLQKTTNLQKLRLQDRSMVVVNIKHIDEIDKTEASAKGFQLFHKNNYYQLFIKE